MIKILYSSLIALCCCFSAAGQTSKFVTLNGIKTHYLEWGKGEETIVLLHSLTDTAEIWKDFAPLLGQNYRIIAPDRRGVGNTEKTASGYEINVLAKDTIGLIDSLKLGKVHLIGHSFGGNIAAATTASAPEKIKSLVLIEGGFWARRKPGVIPDCPVLVDNDCLISNTIKREMGDYDAEKFYSKISVPMLLIMGIPPKLTKSDLNSEEEENKKFFDEAVNHMRETAKDKLKNGESLLIKNAQHWVFVDQPAIVADSLLRFYKNK